MLKNLDAGGTKTKYRIIEEAAEPYTVTELCKFFGVSRSGYYAFLKRKDNDPDETLFMKVYTKHDGKYGYRQIQMHLLQDHDELVNHKKVLRLMQEWGSALEYALNAPELSKCRVIALQTICYNATSKADQPNQKWVTDETQYRVYDTKLYLSTIKDLYNGEIIASHMSLRNDNQLVLQTFEKAFRKEVDVPGLIVHSDQGFQYKSYDYHKTCC